MSLPSSQQERRRFFRLDDDIRLRYQPVTQEQMDTPAASLFPSYDLRSMLANHDTHIEHLLSELRVKEPLVAELVVQLNQKYQCLADQVIADKVAVTGETHPVVTVNISACGLSFIAAESLAVDAYLHIDMILLPGNQRVTCYARVVACEALAPAGYRWRLDFYRLRSVEQELLIQHLVKRQTQLMRAARDTPPV